MSLENLLLLKPWCWDFLPLGSVCSLSLPPSRVTSAHSQEQLREPRSRVGLPSIEQV